MSISEQIIRIQNEVTSQENLIEQIVAALESKAAPAPGTDTSDATATAGDILSGKTAYVNGEKLTGTYVPPAPEQITFTVVGKSYTATLGMKWEEFANNNGWYILENDGVFEPNSGPVGYYDYYNKTAGYPVPIRKTDYIWSGYNYTNVPSGGSND